MTENKIFAVDLFCGVGGKTHGFIKAGIPVVAGYDIDESCQYAYEYNNPGAKFFVRSIEALSAKEVLDRFPSDSFKVLIGCAPCQPFSTYSYRYGAANHKTIKTDERWSLLFSFLRIIQQVKPDIVSAENVPQLSRLKHEVYLDFINGLKNMGYTVTEQIVRCADYGVPQTRERLVVLASLHGQLSIMPPTHSVDKYINVSQAIGHLPAIEAGNQPNSTDPLHISSKLSALNLRRIKITPEGGGWQNWPNSLRSPCHKKLSGSTYPSVYGRMSWKSLAPTITTQCFGLGNGRFGHPSQDRAISLREAAILQTFPENYAFVSPENKITFRNVGRHIGNAVPVKLAEAIAKSILEHFALLNLDAPPAQDTRVSQCSA